MLLAERAKFCAPAKMAALWANCLEEMTSLYYPPFRAADEAELLVTSSTALRAYVEDLIEFSDDVIAKAWKEVRRAHKVERWPTIGAIREACLARVPRGSSPGAVRADHQAVDKFPHKDAANAFLRTAQGQWAIRHRCALGAWQHVAEFKEPPSRDQLQRIHDQTRRNEEIAATLKGALAATLRDAWAAREEREDRLAAEFEERAA